MPSKKYAAWPKTFFTFWGAEYEADVKAPKEAVYEKYLSWNFPISSTILLFLVPACIKFYKAKALKKLYTDKDEN